ncbi:VCBS repeat-containing protein [Streptomyces sp. NPDC050803]|uniref:FG-GAP repeat domain-containing protein n=1 Tax=unclassified Streptomyces TaxID=2593676 RepID=UPI00343290FF
MPEPVSRRMRRTVVVAIALLAGGVTALPVANATTTTPSVRQDFNGDGYEDLATGVPWGRVNGLRSAGYVAVVYGSANGLTSGTKKVYTQESPGIPGTVEAHDMFGAHLTVGDLDADGYADLVVETDNEQWVHDGIARDGNRIVLWGGKGGLTSGTVLPVLSTAPGQGGTSLTGDFNGDGHLDLARRDDVRFGPFGRDGAAASVQKGVRFAESGQVTALAAGDTDGDGISDIVSVAFSGSDSEYRLIHHMSVLRGSRDGLLPPATLEGGESRSKQWNQSLAIGDLDGDGRAEVVSSSGNALRIFRGTEGGPATTPQVITQDTPGVPGAHEEEDSFGYNVSVGDVDGDGYGDILAGNWTESFGGLTYAGNFAVVPGGPAGPTGAGTKVFSQASASVPGTAEARDHFGGDTHLLDSDGDGRAEPIVAAPGENNWNGGLWAFRSTSAGATAKGSVSFGARSFGMTVNGDRFGDHLPD